MARIIHLKLLGFLLGRAKCQVLSALFYSTGTIPTAATCCASPSSISPQPAAPLPEPVRPCVRAKSPAADPAPPRPVRAPGGHVRSERRWKKRRFEIHDWYDSNPSYVSQLFLYLACCCDTLVLGLKLDAE